MQHHRLTGISPFLEKISTKKVLKLLAVVANNRSDKQTFFVVEQNCNIISIRTFFSQDPDNRRAYANTTFHNFSDNF